MMQEGTLTPYLRMEAYLFRMAQNGCPTWIFIFPSAPRYHQAQYHQGACILRNSIDVPFPMAHRYRFVYYRTVIKGWMQLTSMEVHLPVQNFVAPYQDSTTSLYPAADFCSVALKQDSGDGGGGDAEVFVAGRVVATSCYGAVNDGFRTAGLLEQSAMSNLFLPMVQVCNYAFEFMPLQMVKQDENWYLHFQHESTQLVKEYNCSDRNILPLCPSDNIETQSIECTDDSNVYTPLITNYVLRYRVRNGEFVYMEADDGVILTNAMPVYLVPYATIVGENTYIQT